MLQMSQECLTGLVSMILLCGGELTAESEVAIVLALVSIVSILDDLDLSWTGSESPSDSLASSEEKSLPLEDFWSQDELVDGVVDSELSWSTLLLFFRSASLEPGLFFSAQQGLTTTALTIAASSLWIGSFLTQVASKKNKILKYRLKQKNGPLPYEFAPF